MAEETVVQDHEASTSSNEAGGASEDPGETTTTEETAQAVAGVPEGSEVAPAADAGGQPAGTPEGKLAEDGPPAEEPIESIRLDIDGREVVLKTSEVEDLVRRRREVDAALKKADGYSREFEAILKRLVDDPMQLLLEAYTGVEGDEERAAKKLATFCDKFLGSFWQYEQMPEEKREAIRLRKKSLSQERELEKLRRERDEDKRVAEEAEKFRQLSAEVLREIEQHGLPKKARVVEVVQRIVRDAREEGIPVTIAEAAGLAKEEIRREAEERLKELQTDGSFEGLFPDLVKKLDQARAEAIRRARAKNGREASPAAAAQHASPEVGKPRVYRDFEDLLKV